MGKRFLMKKLIAIILITLLCLSCGKKEDDVIKIGVIMPLTGPVAEPGKNALNGIELAVEKFNKNNQQQIKLIVEDSKSNPAEGVSAINKLITANNVKIVIGDLMSSVFLAIAPIAERNKIVSISPGASNPKVRDAGDYIFRNYTSDDFDGYVMANYLYKKMSKRFVAVFSVNNDYGLGVKNVFNKQFEKLGGKVVFNETYKQGETDFRSLLIKLNNLKTDVLYIVGNPTECGYLVKQLKELGIHIPITGNLSFENYEFIGIAKGTFDSIIFSSLYFDNSSEKENIKEFVTEYKKRFNKIPDIASALGYDVANILQYVLIKNDYDVSKVKDALYKVKNFEGTTGYTSFDEKGDVLKDMVIKKIFGDGKIETVEIFNAER